MILLYLNIWEPHLQVENLGSLNIKSIEKGDKHLNESPFIGTIEAYSL